MRSLIALSRSRGRRRRAVRLEVVARRRPGIERVVARRERRQTVQALDELQGRDVLGRAPRRDDAAAAQQWRDDPHRDTDAEPVRVDLRRRDVVEEPAMLVVGEQERRSRPERRRAQRPDHLLLEAHADRHVGGRVLVDLVREARDEPRDRGKRAGGAVVEVVVLRAEGARVVRPAAPEDRDVVALAARHVVDAAEVVDPPRHPGVLEQVEDDRPGPGVEDPKPKKPFVVMPPEVPDIR